MPSRAVRLRSLADVNPAVPEFDRLSGDQEVTFVPLEAVWPSDRLDVSRSRLKSEVATGYARFRQGDILVPKVAPTFQAARSVLAVHVPRGVGAASTEVHVVRPKPGVDPRYVAYAFHTSPFLGEGVSAFQGVAGLQRVPDIFLRDFRIRALEPVEQTRVADFLDYECNRIDSIIRLREAQIASLRERHRQFAREVTTTGRGGEARQTHINWMPEVAVGWSLPKVAWVFRTGSGTTPPSENRAFYDGGIPWVNTGDIKDAWLESTSKSVTQQALTEFSTLRMYSPGSLVLAMYGQGATKGRVAILDVAACVNQACCVLTADQSGLTEWAFYWFQAHKDQIVQLAIGSGQPNLNQEIVRSLRIPLPRDEERLRLTGWLGEQQRLSQEATSEMVNQVEGLRNRKRSLITAAVAGEFDATTASGRGI